MNKVATKWLSATAIALAMAGGSVAVAMPAAAAGSVSQNDNRHHDGDKKNHDNKDHDGRGDRVDDLCDFLEDRFNLDDDDADIRDSDKFDRIVDWYDDNCDDD